MRECVIPWEEIRKRYEDREMNGRELAKAYGVSYQALYRKAAAQGWKGYRKGPEASAKLQMQKVARQLVRLTRDAAGKVAPEDIKAVKDLAGVLQTLVGLEKTLGGGDAAQDGAVQVVMAEDVEELSR